MALVNRLKTLRLNPRITVRDAIALFVMAQILGAFWAAGLVSVAGWKAPVGVPVIFASNVGLWLVLLGGPILVSRLRGSDPRTDYGVSLAGRDVAIGGVSGVILQLVLVPLLYIPIGWFTDEDPSAAAEDLFARADGTRDLTLLFILVVVIAPVVEEFFYRGLLMRTLDARWGAVEGVLGSAMIFAVAHGQLVQLPGLLLFGVAAGAIARYYGRLGPSWALHAAFNATSFVMLL